MFLMKRRRALIGFLIAAITVMMPAAALGADAGGVDATGLTLDKAVDMALVHSPELRQSDYDIESKQKSLEDAEDNLNAFTPAADGNQVDSVANSYVSMIQKSISLEIAKKSRSTKADAVVKSVFQAYTDVLTAQDSVAIAEKELAYADYQRLAARVGYQVGKVSLTDKNTAEANYTKKEAALNESRTNLAESYQNFNDLIGINLKDRPVLTDNPVFEPLKVADLDTEVLHRLEENPNLWQADKNVESAKMNFNMTNSDWDTNRINVQKAELTAYEDKEQAKQTVYNIYNTICQQEEQYKTLEQSLKQAEDSLKVAQLKYELGMIPRGDVLSAELSTANAQKALRTAAYQHELTKITFEKPWLS
ncbi:MAG: TolC family protein [Firmicutes bacterium]|nr:TolC family protein [Bacillota bacterium]